MDEKVDEYIKKQKSPQKEICQKLRELVLKTVPDINEEMRVGVPCYGHTKEDICGKYYIAALKDHVNLGFSLKGLSWISKPDTECPFSIKPLVRCLPIKPFTPVINTFMLVKSFIYKFSPII